MQRVSTVRLPAAAETEHRGVMLRQRAGRSLRVVLVVAFVGVLLDVVLPRVAGVSWLAVRETLGSLGLRDLVVLSGVWIGGLLLHTFTLTAALPGLTHRRALLLSLTGSAVANALPVGGAAGVALNYRMTRAWGHDRVAFAVYTVVTNVWDVAAKLFLLVAALPLLLMSTFTLSSLPGWLLRPVLYGVPAVALVLLAVVGVATSARATALVAGRLDASLAAVARQLGRKGARRPGARLLEVRHQCAGLVARRWPRLTFGILAYSAGLAALLILCCHAVGVGLAVPALLLGFVVERVLTLAALTPGGAGVVEVGLVAVLTALGGDPAATVSAVLLYRLFTFALEIPVGGLGLAGWLWLARPAAVAAP